MGRNVRRTKRLIKRRINSAKNRLTKRFTKSRIKVSKKRLTKRRKVSKQRNKKKMKGGSNSRTLPPIVGPPQPKKKNLMFDYSFDYFYILLSFVIIHHYIHIKLENLDLKAF